MGRQPHVDQHLTQAARFGSSPDASAPPIRPLDLRYVTENTAPQDTGERPRKPANFRMASHTDAIISALMPGNIGLLGRGWRQFPQ